MVSGFRYKAGQENTSKTARCSTLKYVYTARRDKMNRPISPAAYRSQAEAHHKIGA